jgi:hypothetical protein
LSCASRRRESRPRSGCDRSAARVRAASTGRNRCRVHAAAAGSPAPRRGSRESTRFAGR